MRYRCKICGKLSHQEECPNCLDLGLTEKIEVPYCEMCHMPVWNVKNDGKCNKCGNRTNKKYKDIVPVFLEEKILLSAIYDEDIYNKIVWNIGSNRYLVNSKRLTLKANEINNIEDILKIYEEIKKDLDSIELLNKEKSFLASFVKYNKDRFLEIELEAHEYIKDVYEDNRDRISLVSFSGGKDSIVVSDIVRQALTMNDILHIFGDTTLEMDETINFVEEFKKGNPRIPFIIAKSDKDFNNLCEEIGPPTRIRSWCCSVFKSGPIAQVFNFVNHDKTQQKFLTFYGVRAEESASRNKYSRTSDSPKITSQRVASPIFGWLDYDVWLYILSRDISFNTAYRFGFRRVGCWCCPNNSGWSELLNRIFYSEKYLEWKSFLYDFAQKIGKLDYEVYIDEGFWKARHGGNGLDNEHTKINKTSCIDKQYENYLIKRSYSDDFDEYMKPFGKIQKTINEEYLVLEIYNKKSNKKLFRIETKYSSKILKLKVYEKKNQALIKKRIECQLRKYQICIKCSACDSICPKGAISTLNNLYRIDEMKCVHCLECVAKHFTGGCLMNEVLIQKSKED